MKLIIAGPPHSGKSVFISMLKTLLESGELSENNKLFPLSLDATPDGETNYVKENYHNEELVKSLRKKGSYTDKLRKYVERCITNSKHPLMTIDIGGKFNDDDKPMLQNATHAIILSGGEVVTDENKGSNNFEKSVAEWTEFFKSMNISVLTSIYSDLHSKVDYKLDDQTPVIHNLERESFENMGRANIEDVRKRPTLRIVAKLIIDELKRNNEYDDLVKISQQKESMESNNGLTVIQGAYSGHKLPLVVSNEINNGQKVAFYDRMLGEQISIQPLKQGETNRNWFDEPEYVGVYQGKKIYHIRTLLNHSQNILLPEDLENLMVPRIPDDAIVKISSTGSQWFGAIVAASYIEKCQAITIAMPKEKGSAVIWSKKDSEIAVCDEKTWLKRGTKGFIPDLPTVFLDMDGVLADFDAGKEILLNKHPEYKEQYKGKYKNMPSLFENLPPVENAIETALWVAQNFNTYILTSSPWNNPTALQAKQDWIIHHFTDDSGFNPFKRKMIITHHKDLLKGDILIDDRNSNGVHNFNGEHIWFGRNNTKNWGEVKKKLSDMIEKLNKSDK